MKETLADKVSSLIFDGAYVYCRDLETEILVLEACRLCEASLMTMDVKVWPEGLLLTIPRPSLRKALAAATEDENVVTSIRIVWSLRFQHDCDLSNLVDHEGPLSATAFNAAAIHSLQRAVTAGLSLVHVAVSHILQGTGGSSTWCAHHPLPHGQGHWYGATLQDNNAVKIVDVSAGAQHLRVSFPDFAQLLQQDSQTTWFCLSMVAHDVQEEAVSVYELLGSAQRAQVARPAQTKPL